MHKYFMKLTGVLLATLWLAMGNSYAADQDAEVSAAISQLQHRWEVIKYQTEEKQQEAAYETLAREARQLSIQYAGRAEPRIWEAIILSTYAGARGGLGALGLVKDARALLLEAEAMDPGALHGSLYTTLGSLYYQVPGWPIGFGDDKQARVYLEKALQYNPDGIDPNFFYGDFLLEEGEYARAVEVFSKALQAAPRPGRVLSDAGRREEIQAKLERARSHL